MDRHSQRDRRVSNRTGAARRSDSPAPSGFRVRPVPRFDRGLISDRVDGEIVTVVRVLHSARDIPSILEE